jgi:CRP/FNR family transcriptional regulator
VQCELKTVFFNSFQENQLEMFCIQKKETNYRKGDIIIREGDEITDFIYLKSGLVKLHRNTRPDRDQIIIIALPFDFISLLSVFSTDRYNYSVTAIEDSVVCSIPMSSIKKYAMENGKFSFNLIERMSKASDKIILESLAIRSKYLKGKVAYLLLKFSREIYRKPVFELPLSRREIAEYIGMTTENVIRTLSEFRNDRLIRINGKEIEIAHEEALSKIADFG